MIFSLKHSIVSQTQTSDAVNAISYLTHLIDIISLRLLTLFPMTVSECTICETPVLKVCQRRDANSEKNSLTLLCVRLFTVSQ